MSLIPFPNVPNLPGVPAIPRNGAASAALSIIVGTAANFLQNVIFNGGQWGIYDDTGRAIGNQTALTGLLAEFGLTNVTSTREMSYNKEMRVSDFPVERGGFASYNKVELPGNPIVTLCMGGTVADKANFLTEIDAATKSTNLYSVATPEATYINYSIERYNYQRRNTNGSQLLIVELSLIEIREVSAAFTTINQPKDPGASPQQDTGKVQAKTPDQSTLKSLSKQFGSIF